jgi:type I restriction enzyme S subunit
MKRWPTRPLLEICSPKQWPTISTPELSKAGFPVYGANGQIGFYRSYNHEDPTILITCRGATCGTLNISPPRAYVTGNAMALDNPNLEVIDFKFLYYALLGRGLQDTITGAAQPQITRTSLSRVSVPVPPIAEQERIVSLLVELDELRKLRTQSDHCTAGLVPALFHEMFGDPGTNPFGWPMMRAGEFMETCDYGTSQKANDAGRGIVVLRMGNVTTNGELNLDNLKTVELAEDELARQRLRAGDILFNRTNSRELVGKTGMWDGRFEAVAASYFIRARLRSDIEHPQHFTTFMNLPYMKRRLAEMARGAIGQANINAKELKSIPVPVPPMALQMDFSNQVAEIRTLENQQAACRRVLEDLFNSMLHKAFNGEL